MASAIQTDIPAPANDNRYSLGVWVGLAGILMMFTGLTSAYIVRSGLAQDWRQLAMPRILLFSTAVLLVSSGTLELARRQISDSVRRQRWLLLTAGLGFVFLAAQVVAWRELAAQGVYLATDPHRAFYYVLTATHGLHLLGGLLALVYLLIRRQRQSKGKLEAVSVYWHFMDVLWIFLFLLLFLWR